MCFGCSKPREEADRSQPRPYDPAVLVALEGVSEKRRQHNTLQTPLEVRVLELRLGDVVVSSVQTLTGLRLLSSGQAITPALMERLLNFQRVYRIKEPVLVMRS